jgi:hypothetical protein
LAICRADAERPPESRIVAEAGIRRLLLWVVGDFPRSIRFVAQTS